MKKIIRSITLALVVAFVLVLIKNEYARFLLSHANFGVSALITRYQEKELDDGNGVNVFIGSSMFRKGLDINELNNNVEGTNYILAYNGTRPFQCYEELEYIIDNNVKVRHLYVDLYAFAMTVDPWIEDSRLLLETDLSFKCKLWKNMSAFAESPVKDFWEMFVTTGNDRLLAWPIDYKLTNAQFINGGNLQFEAGGGVAGMEQLNREDTLKSLKSKSFENISKASFNKDQLWYVKETIKLCKDKNIPLSFIETPKYYSIMTEDQYVSLMKSYIELLNQYDVQMYLVEDSVYTCKSLFDAKKNGRYVISFDTGNLDYYVDWLHLSSNGRTAFTKNLSKAIKESK